MRAKSVNEFKQGGNPFDTMNIGSNRKFKDGDKIEILKTIFYDNRGAPELFFTKEEFKSLDDWAADIQVVRVGQKFIFNDNEKIFEPVDKRRVWQIRNPAYSLGAPIDWLEWLMEHKDHWKRI
jgi:hypothetical protein